MLANTGIRAFAYHIEVGKSSSRGPEHGASLHRSQPKEVGEQKGKNGYPLVVIGTSNGARDVARYDSHETCG